MPIKGWICPGTRLKVPWDHFDCCDHGPNGRSAASPFLTRLEAVKIAEDVRHQGLGLTATRLLGCPRQLYIQHTHDYWADPKERAAMSRGTALHAKAAEVLNPVVWSTESRDPVRHDLRGMLGPYKVSALADAWRHDLTEVIDFKFPLDWSVKFRSKAGVAKDDHCAQLNIERLLLAQQPWAIERGFNAETVKLTVYDHALGQAEGPLAQAARHMTVEEVLAYRPGGSAITVADHAALLESIAVEHAKLAPGDGDAQGRLAAAVPLVGRPMFNGKKCESYCDVKERCDELVRQFGVPS